MTIICPECGGEGIADRPPLRRCRRCKGTGRVPGSGPYKVVGRPTNAAQNEAQEAFSRKESEDSGDG